jgi:hypothetical protein
MNGVIIYLYPTQSVQVMCKNPVCNKYYPSTLPISTHVHQIINSFILKDSFQQMGIFLNIHYYTSQFFLIWKKIIFENFIISENNRISVELAKVLWYYAFNC